LHHTSTDYHVRPLTLTLSPEGERGPEQSAPRSYWRLAIIALLVFINGLVLFNAIRHDPRIGYDAEHHLRYVRVVADGRLPTRGNSREFFSPPAPYVVPALVTRVLAVSGESAAWYGAKAGQLMNVLASIGLTVAVLQLCALARPRDDRFKAIALLLLAMLPVYYKSFAFLRGEPLLACFAIFATVQFMRILTGDTTARRAALLGALLGLCILSRQWAFFLFPAFALVALITKRNITMLKCAAIAGAIALFVGGWFYGLLLARYGTVIPFNREPQPGPIFSTQPLSFYTSLHARELFSRPTRGAFPNRLFPIFYTETWGDYWGYFASDRAGDSPPRQRYLGRVNAVSIVPTALLIAGVAFGLWQTMLVLRSGDVADATSLLHAACAAVIFCSAIGYGWFLLRYPDRTGDGDTIKATYMLHAFPLLAILAGAMLSRLPRRTSALCLAVLLAVVVHNLPAMITRHGASAGPAGGHEATMSRGLGARPSTQ
jgi:hypothetical protein